MHLLEWWSNVVLYQTLTCFRVEVEHQVIDSIKEQHYNIACVGCSLMHRALNIEEPLFKHSSKFYTVFQCLHACVPLFSCTSTSLFVPSVYSQEMLMNAET